jgi:peptide/nickel transport system ATP-binding protein
VSAGLDFQDIVVDYPRRHDTSVRAVAGVSLEIARGEIVGLVGESGCGKSTLALTAVGLLSPAAGRVLYRGKPVSRLHRRTRPREELRLQMVFQDPFTSLNPRRPIGRQITDALVDLPRKARETRAGELLELVGLPDAIARRYPHEFSGGQRQRIAIARALSVDPDVIIADEPVASLDASSQAQIANLLADLCRDRNVGLLFISHDLLIVNQIADRIAVMYLGCIVETGPTEDLWNEPLHPYTKALIQAVPLPDQRRRIPTTLPGEVPDPARPPEGCRLRPRCPEVFAPCLQEPGLRPVGHDRAVACWLHNEPAQSPESGRPVQRPE